MAILAGAALRPLSDTGVSRYGEGMQARFGGDAGAWGGDAGPLRPPEREFLEGPDLTGEERLRSCPGGGVPGARAADERAEVLALLRASGLGFHGGAMVTFSGDLCHFLSNWSSSLPPSFATSFLPLALVFFVDATGCPTTSTILCREKVRGKAGAEWLHELDWTLRGSSSAGLVSSAQDLW